MPGRAEPPGPSAPPPQLATQGEPTHPCSDAQLLRECTAALPDRAYQLYVEFLGHAANICLFIQNQVGGRLAHAGCRVVAFSIGVAWLLWMGHWPGAAPVYWVSVVVVGGGYSRWVGLGGADENVSQGCSACPCL